MRELFVRATVLPGSLTSVAEIELWTKIGVQIYHIGIVWIDYTLCMSSQREDFSEGSAFFFTADFADEALNFQQGMSRYASDS